MCYSREPQSAAANQGSVLQLYAAILDDIREKALAIVQWAEDSKREYETVTGQAQGGDDAR